MATATMFRAAPTITRAQRAICALNVELNGRPRGGLLERLVGRHLRLAGAILQTRSAEPEFSLSLAIGT